MKKRQEKLKISVTQKVIDKSVPGDCGHCLIAEALRAKGASSVNIDAQYARFNLDGLRYIFSVPASAAMQVILFDQAGPTAIKPFQLRLQNGFSKPVEKRGAHKKKSTIPTVRKTATVVAKRSKRRYHGIRMIELASGQKLKA